MFVVLETCIVNNIFEMTLAFELDGLFWCLNLCRQSRQCNDITRGRKNDSWPPCF
jgi:hypothetical protein